MSAGDRYVEAAWVDPPDNGSPITRNELELQGGPTHIVPVGEGRTVFGGLTNGREYWVRGRSCNDVGCSAWSRWESARPRVPTAITITAHTIPGLVPGCDDDDCRPVQIDADGLEPNRTYAVTCFSTERGQFGTGSITATADGRYDDSSGCSYDTRGHHVWLTLDGTLRSNTITWSPR